MADTVELLSNITKLLSNPDENDHVSRDQLLSQIDKLRLAVETPRETIFRIGYQPWQHSAIRLAIELKIFNTLVQAGKTRINIDQLASEADADAVLVTRLLRMLVALGLCTGNPIDGYESNSKTAILTVPEGRDSFKIWADLSAPTANELTRYFRTHGYGNPKHATDSAFVSAFGDEFWIWKSTHPDHSAVFDSFMATRRIGRPLWFDLYPVQEGLIHGLDGEGVAIVDVGGNRGHDLLKFKNQYPELAGRLILQDLPEVLSKIENRPEGIELVAHDFFQPQSIKGARAYFFRAIFHDWPTDSCQQILQHTASAMKPGYSKLLISDFVLNDNDPQIFSASLDLQMMGLHCGMERSKTQWTELLESAGLRITGIYQRSKSGESVIEAELAETRESPSLYEMPITGAVIDSLEHKQDYTTKLPVVKIAAIDDLEDFKSASEHRRMITPAPLVE